MKRYTGENTFVVMLAYDLDGDGSTMSLLPDYLSDEGFSYDRMQEYAQVVEIVCAEEVVPAASAKSMVGRKFRIVLEEVELCTK